MIRKSKVGKSTKKKAPLNRYSSLINLEDCLPPPARLNASYWPKEMSIKIPLAYLMMSSLPSLNLKS